MNKEYDWPRDVTMVGGFETKLTTTQGNNFRQFLDDNKVFQDYCNLTFDIRATELALQGGNIHWFEKLRSLYKQQQQLEKQLFAISKEWCEKNIKKESEVKTKET